MPSRINLGKTMLDAFRTHKRWLMFIAMVLIIPSFIVTGIYSYNRMRQADDAIVKVGNVSITPQMFDQQKRQQLEGLREQLGDNFKASILDNKAGREGIIEQLANQTAVEQAVTNNFISISEQDAVNVIKSTAAFQENGKFMPARYEQFLRSRGTSDQAFVQEVRQDLARQTLTMGIFNSSVVPEGVVLNLHRALTMKNDLRTRVFDINTYMTQVKVSDADIKANYDANQKLYTAPEEVSIQYLTLSPDDIVIKAQPSEEEMHTYYEQNKARWGVPEERRASHILIAFDEKNKDVEATRKKAEEVLAKVKADPENFAKYAKEYSNDPGSAQEGGDLNFFGRGMMVEPFEKAVFSAKKGDIIGPVQTEYGMHIIEVTDIRPSTVKPFEAVRAEIEKNYRQQQAVREFAERAEEFTNMSYERPESLEPIAEKFGLKIQTAEQITRDGPVNPALRAIINDHVVESLFSTEALKDKHNIAAVEVRPNLLVTARVLKHSPKHLRPLDEVKGDIELALKQTAAAKLAETDGEKLMAALAGKTSDEGFSPVATVSINNAQNISQDLILRASMIPDAKLPAYTGAHLADGSYVVAQVLKHEYVAPKAGELASIRNELTQLYGNTEVLAYMHAMRKELGEKVLRPSFIEGSSDNQDNN